jgi:hypothetical protein
MTIKFLSGWTLNFEKLPKYKEFQKPFVVDLPINYLDAFLHSDEEFLIKEIKDLILNVGNVVKNDILEVTHSKRLVVLDDFMQITVYH